MEARKETGVAGAEARRERAREIGERVFSDAGSAGSLPRVRAELLQLAPLLMREPRLRKTIADIGVPDEAKKGFLRALFENRVDPHTLSLLESLVGEEGLAWRLPAVVEDLAIQATLAEAQQDGTLEEVEGELFRFARLLQERSDLRSALSDPVLPAGNKGALLEELLEGKVAGATLILLRRAVAPPGDPVARIQELADRAASRRGRVMVEARTAVELDAERRGRLARALSGVTGRDVDLEVTVDAQVVGGVMARVGDEIIDGTIRRRLELALEQIAG